MNISKQLLSIFANTLNSAKLFVDNLKLRFGLSSDVRNLECTPTSMSWCEKKDVDSLKNHEILSQSNPIFFRKSSRNHSGIYILAYHSILNPSQCDVWETSYTKVATSLENFKEHIQILKRDEFKCISLEESRDRLRFGEVDRPYVVFTFDDGYKNIMNVLPVFEKEKVCGTAFINGAFASQSKIYYRVLASILKNQGFLEETLPLLDVSIPEICWSQKSEQLFSQLKNQYYGDCAEKIDSIILQAYTKVYGINSIPRCHLNINELREFDPNIMSIASHGWSHKNLTSVQYAEIEGELDQNIHFFLENKIPFSKQLAYPNGQLAHVGIALDRWLEKNKEWSGYFCNGGVNYKMFRKVGLRIPVGNLNGAAFSRLLKIQAECGKIFVNKRFNFSNHADN